MRYEYTVCVSIIATAKDVSIAAVAGVLQHVAILAHRTTAGRYLSTLTASSTPQTHPYVLVVRPRSHA